MAKLSRIVARIFGSGAGPDQISQFGSLFAGSPAFTTDPAVAQSLSNWLTGWSGAAIGGNAPAIEDMNAAFFVLAYQIAYMLQAGIGEWNTDTIYYTGSLAMVDGVIYVSLADTNTGNAVTDLTKWQRYGNSSGVAIKTSSYNVTVNDSLLVGSAAGGGFPFNLPPAADCPGKELDFKKIDSTANAITLTPSGSDLIDGAASATLTVPNEATTLRSDGVASWYII